LQEHSSIIYHLVADFNFYFYQSIYRIFGIFYTKQKMEPMSLFSQVPGFEQQQLMTNF